MESRGKFITFEGGDGSGKSTQSQLLYAALKKAGIPVVLTREPGGTKGAEEIRDLVVKGDATKWDRMTETLLFIAARRDHVEKKIKPALERGEWVISDRFVDSTYAYQGYGHGVQLNLIDGLHRLALDGFAPDVTLIYNIDYDEGLDRANARIGSLSEEEREDRFEKMSMLFHKNVQKGFLERASADPKRCEIIKAVGAIHDIHSITIGALNKRIRANLGRLSDAEIDSVLKG